VTAGVLFIPGIDERWDAVWSHTAAAAHAGDFWPGWLEADLKESMPGIGVWCLEAPVRTDPPISVQKQAGAILELLDRSIRGCPLLIIANGTGGLLASHILQLSAASTTTSMRSVADKTLGLLLLSPPFHGYRFMRSHPEIDKDSPFVEQLRNWL